MSFYFLITKDFILFDKNLLKIKESNSNKDNHKIVKHLLLEDLVNEEVFKNNLFFNELIDIYSNLDCINKELLFINNIKIISFINFVNLFNVDKNKYKTLIRYYKEKVSVGLMLL